MLILTPQLSDYHTLFSAQWWKMDPPGWPLLSKMYASVYDYIPWKAAFRSLPRRECGFKPKLMECVILEKNRIEFLVSFTCWIADRTLRKKKKKSQTVWAPSIWIPQQTKGHLFTTYLFINSPPGDFFSSSHVPRCSPTHLALLPTWKIDFKDWPCLLVLWEFLFYFNGKNRIPSFLMAP